MAYRVQAGNPVTILHGLLDLAGTGYVTGQAGANWNLKVYNDSRVLQGSITPVIAEIGTTGWYTFTFTIPAASSGIWSLDGTEPAGAAGDFVYPITVTTGILGSSAKDLTTLARVKERVLQSSAGTTFDSLLASLITEESNAIQDELGRCIPESAYTEYYDGRGTPSLVLRQGPLVSVTSVHHVDYIDSGGGVRGETLTAIEEHERLEYCLRSEGCLGVGRIEWIGGSFERGQKNYKVVYTAGFATIPEGLVKHATDAVATAYFTRMSKGVISETIGDIPKTFLSPRQISDERRRVLSPYKRRVAA